MKTWKKEDSNFGSKNFLVAKTLSKKLNFAMIDLR
jgi:hypothetical protein